MQHKTIAFLASGNGGTLKFVHQAAQRLGLPLSIGDVVADRDCGALDYARAHGLRATRLKYTRTAPEALQQVLVAGQPDLVITNIHKIIDADTLNLLPGRFINLHYSLLPAFKGFIGMETVEQARLLNAGIIGGTCHQVDELVDNGQVLSQCAVPVDWNRDDTTQVYNAVFRGASMALLDGILQKTGLNTAQHTQLLDLAGRPALFSPALSYQAEALDEAFWQNLKG
ncbi:hypothetical protein LJY25_15745 [Hymenobacter sp. BT175]|uniref:formyltransferase family protein n=1 Tax=Hymenobacter translucens TaxID=2886507 RepID=UPI001D0E78BF|nr:formyltransferase family protein [Hymenobacter translucens]MCC2547903.1 hypothetical protein [Hymenobacter translucens]